MNQARLAVRTLFYDPDFGKMNVQKAIEKITAIHGISEEDLWNEINGTMRLDISLAQLIITLRKIRDKKGATS